MKRMMRNGTIATMALSEGAAAFTANSRVARPVLQRASSDITGGVLSVPVLDAQQKKKGSFATSSSRLMSTIMDIPPMDPLSERNKRDKFYLAPQAVRNIRKKNAERRVERHLQANLEAISKASSDSSRAKDQDSNPRVKERTEQKRKNYYKQHLESLARTGLPASPAFIDLVHRARDSRRNDCNHSSGRVIVYSAKTELLFNRLGAVLRDNTVLHNALLRKAFRNIMKAGKISIDDIKYGGVNTYKNKQKHIRKYLKDVIREYITALGITQSDFPDKDIGIIVTQSLGKHTMSGDSSVTWISKAFREGRVLTGKEAIGTQFHHILPKSESPHLAMTPSILTAVSGTEPKMGHRLGEHDLAHQAFGYRSDEDHTVKSAGGYVSSDGSHYSMHDYQAIDFALNSILRKPKTKRETYNLSLAERLNAYQLYYERDKPDPRIARILNKIKIDSERLRRRGKPDNIVNSYIISELRKFPEGQEMVRWQKVADKTVKAARNGM